MSLPDSLGIHLNINAFTSLKMLLYEVCTNPYIKSMNRVKLSKLNNPGKREMLLNTGVNEIDL